MKHDYGSQFGRFGCFGLVLSLACTTGCQELVEALHHHHHHSHGETPAEEVLYVSGNGGTISSFGLDPRSGALTARATLAAGTSPSYLAFSPDEKFLYAIDENGGDVSSVIAYSIDPTDGHLTLINVAPTGGQGAPHLAVHPSGDWIVATHYGSGEISVLPIRDDGGVAEPRLIDKGPDGACTNAHQAVFDRTGDYLFVPCLGSDYLIQYKFDAGQLSYNDPASVTTPSPRHLAFDPAETFAYVISEYDSTLTWFAYDAATGTLSNPHVIDSYQTLAGSSAHVVVHPSGEWLYASNRGENSLGLFSIDAAGTPSPVAFQTDGIDTPRDFSIDPSGKFLILANQNGAQDVFVYRIARDDGQLTRIGATPVGGNPTFTGAIELP
jgi:6-phosphogluconolactonase